MEEIENAITVLKPKIREVRTVHEWSMEMGCSDPKYFARLFRRHFGITCKEALIRVRVEKLFDCIQKNPYQKNYCDAQEVGLPDEVALNKYLRTHIGKNPTEFKRGICTGEITKRSIWKNRVAKKDRNLH
ncbi:MAG: helix-turn-helix domain-containing protein [Balneola sp.]